MLLGQDQHKCGAFDVRLSQTHEPKSHDETDGAGPGWYTLGFSLSENTVIQCEDGMGSLESSGVSPSTLFCSRVTRLEFNLSSQEE